MPESEHIEQGAEELERRFSLDQGFAFSLRFDAVPPLRWKTPYGELQVRAITRAWGPWLLWNAGGGAAAGGASLLVCAYLLVQLQQPWYRPHSACSGYLVWCAGGRGVCG